jgi:hypothetical protein
VAEPAPVPTPVPTPPLTRPGRRGGNWRAPLAALIGIVLILVGGVGGYALRAATAGPQAITAPHFGFSGAGVGMGMGQRLPNLPAQGSSSAQHPFPGTTTPWRSRPSPSAEPSAG